MKQTLRGWNSTLRPMSKRTQAKQTARRRVLAEVVHGKLCVVRWDKSCQTWAVHGHEPLTRARGGDPTDPANVIPVCSYCHGMIHDWPEEATERGWLRRAE